MMIRRDVSLMDRSFVDRRTVLGCLAGSLVAAVWAAEPQSAPRIGNPLAIGNYGMKSLPLEESIRQIAAIGFDGFELCAIPEWNSTPDQMNRDRRQTTRELLKSTGLPLVAVMENLPPSADDQVHQLQLERLRAAIQLGRDLVSDTRPLVQTVLGGGKWDEVKMMLRDRVGEWARLAESLEATVCIKPHRFGAMSTPAHAAWIIEQLGHPRSLRMVYDYSHYALRPESIEGELTIVRSMETSGPILGYAAMKDATSQGDKVTFALPGETGAIDHQAILSGLAATGYHGAFCCEVSAQISNQPGYDPLEAARRCYDRMSAVWIKAGFPRGTR
ncbi:MAG: sugar phosphate isomerase/epimerase [Planctomycetota bacterium]|nr:MAG: sugar phosphate isomerase/epimerase [Planctomycetota bacterium]